MRVRQALDRRHSSSLSRAGDPHVMALRTMFDAIHHTMDEYAALLAERGEQIVAANAVASRRVTAEREVRVSRLVSALTAFVDRVWRDRVTLKSTGDPNAAEACAEMVGVADKWLRFVETTALRDARHRMATGEVSRPD